jgi:hypothetical protein
MVANTFSEEYIFFPIFKITDFLKGQFRKSPGLIRPMPAVRELKKNISLHKIGVLKQSTKFPLIIYNLEIFFFAQRK